MGRMSKKDEELIMSVVNKSWQRVYDILTSRGITNERKDMVALELAKRTAPKNLDITSDGDKIENPVLVRFVSKEEEQE